MKNNLDLIKLVAFDVKKEGGNAYFVGGYVRDKILGKENKDIDVEIFGLEPIQLKSILSKYGEVNEVGASFGVFMINGYDIDFALPRTEKQIGVKHTDFEISVDPFLSLEDASKRRDFTMNSLMQDIITEEIIDFWGGVNDIKIKKIRHIDDNTFVEDALRVFRACQFASRFDFKIDESTLALCSKIDISNLAKERIYEEAKKALLKSNKPSIFFEYLYKMDKLDEFFPEVKDLKGVVQSPVHHPEGDVWTHTMMVLDECANYKHLSSNPLAFMLSGLCHDFGKAVTTTVEPDGKIRSICHEIEGVALAERFLSRLTTDKKLISYVKNMTELHMRPNMLAKTGASKKSSRRMFNESINCEDLILIAKCDHLGRATTEPYNSHESWLFERLEDFRETCSEPLLKGADLIQMGYKPSKEFGCILEEAFKLQMSGLSKYQIIKQLKLKEVKEA